jgi:hypothetical protein
MGEPNMDEETIVKHLWALRKVNDALITGLKTTLLTMESWDNLSPERRQSTIESVKKLISESEKAYSPEPTEDQTSAAGRARNE